MTEMVSRMFRVLLVDDSPTYARSIRHSLETSVGPRFTVKMVDTLHAAFGAVATASPDVILLDFILPDSIGLSTVQEMRSRAPGIPIVALSPIDEEELEKQAVRAGAQDCVFKSVMDRRNLVRVIRYAVAALECERLQFLLARRKADVPLLFDNIDNGVVTTDLHGDCAFCNPAAVRMLGYRSQEDLVGRNFHSLIQGIRAQSNGLHCLEAECHVNKVIRTGVPVHVDTENFSRADGKCFAAEYYASSLRRGDGIIGAITVFREIDQLRVGGGQAQEGRERFERQAQALIRIAGEWALEEPSSLRENDSFTVVDDETPGGSGRHARSSPMPREQAQHTQALNDLRLWIGE